MRKYLIIIFLLLPYNVYAAPSITTVTSGTTFVHGATLTITGSGFEAKTTAAPAIWDDCETGDVTDNWGTVYPSTATNPDHNMQYRDGTYRNVTQAHAQSGTFAVGCHEAGNEANTAGMNVGLCNTHPASANFYACAWIRLDPLWETEVVNHKFLNSSDYCLSHSGGTDTVFYLTHQSEQTEGSLTYLINNYTGSWTTVRAPTITDARSQWVKFEIIVDRDAFVQIYENGAEKYYGTGDTTSNPATYFMIGYYLDAQGDNKYRYFDDIYYDTTWQRVVIANDETYANATKIEIQPPSAWSDTEITVTMNQGQAAAGETWYVFVFDTDNVASTGKAITIGGSGSSLAVSGNGVGGNGVSNNGGG